MEQIEKRHCPVGCPLVAMENTASHSDQLVTHIFSFLPLPTAIAVIPLVCRRWKQIVDDKYSLEQQIFKGQAFPRDDNTDEKRYRKAYDLLCTAASCESKCAQRVLLETIEQPLCKLKWARFFYEAATRNDSWGLYCLGRIYLPYNLKRGLTLLNRSRLENNPYATFLLGKILHNNCTARKAVPSCKNSGWEMIYCSAILGLREAQYEYARYAFRDALETRVKLGSTYSFREFYCKSANQNFAPALNRLSQIEDDNDNEERMKYLFKAATQGTGNYYGREFACSLLGKEIALLESQIGGFIKGQSDDLINQGDSPREEDKTWTQLIMECSHFEVRKQKGILEDHYQIGYNYHCKYKKNGCCGGLEKEDQDLNEEETCLKWLNECQVAYRSYPHQVPFILGLMSALGIFFPKDQQKAEDYILRGIKECDPKNIFKNKDFKTDKTIPLDHQFSFLNKFEFVEQLFAFLIGCAQEGKADFQFILGLFCQSNLNGFTQEDALNWFVKAADQGHCDSCYFAFRIYKELGDFDFAAHYFDKFTGGSPVLSKMLLEEV